MKSDGDCRRVRTPKIVLSLNPDEAVAVGQKLSMIGERPQEQCCLFQTIDYRNKRHDTDKLTWVCFPTKLFVDRKVSMTEEWRLDKSCLYRRKKYSNNNRYKSVLGSSPAEGFSLSRKLRNIEERCKEIF
jgi:hypothetical protein